MTFNMPKIVLPNIRSPLKGIAMFRQTKEVLAVDLSGEVVKIVHAQDVSGKMQVVHIASREFGQNAEAGTAQFLREMLKAWNVKTRRVVCTLPSRHFISRNIDMPSNNPEEIAKIINLQLGRFTPYSRDEIVVDYISREMEGMHYTNVLLLIVHRKVIEHCLQVVELAGLGIERIAIGAEALVRHYVAAGSNPTIAGLHISEESSDLTIVDKGQLAFVRNINMGIYKLIKDPSVAIDAFVEELKKSLAAYQDEGVGQQVKSLMITGALDGSDSLVSAIKAGIPGIRENELSVELTNLGTTIAMTEETIKTLQSNPRISYLDLMAAAINAQALRIDLTPSEIKLKRNVREGGRDVMAMGILIMTIFLMVSFLLSLKIYFKSVQIQKLDKIDRETFEPARAMERISTKSRAVRKLLENRGRGLYVFDKVTALIGDDIYLVQFSYDTEGNLVLAGTAASMSRIFAFVTQLEESNYFSSVKTKETKSRREGKQEVADFIIESTLAEGF